MRKKKLYHQFACSSLILPEHRARLAQHHQKKSPGGMPRGNEFSRG